MKQIISILIPLIFTLFQSCKAQQIQSSLPKIENYSKGELELRTTSFGEDNPISIGKIAADGTIHLDWPDLDLNKMTEHKYYETSINYLIKAKYCKDPKAIITNEDAKLVKNELLYLFKYDRVVGCIIPSTQKGQEHRSDQLGSTLYWIYSDGETSAQANCSVKKEWEDLYSFDETTAYDLTFKKGWNIVSNTLNALEEYNNGNGKSSLPKTKVIQTVNQIPKNIYWHVKYWANDELLEMEQQLLAKTPITKQEYENWIPKNLGTLKRTGFEIGKKLERVPILNNASLIFENASQKLDLTIVDCVGSKDAAAGYTMQQDMASRDWEDKTETGYDRASEMDGIRVITIYNKHEVNTSMSYNSNDRFFIIAKATNIEPDELWKYLKTLHLEKLSKV